MPKPKTRVSVRYDGKDRGLFSVRENGDQSLTIIFQTALNSEDEKTGTDVRIIQHKISVHVSPSSPGTTLLRTVNLAGGRTLSKAQYIKDSKTSLFCVAHSLLCPQLSADHYLLKARARDVVVRIGAFGASDSTSLIYHVVVADHAHPMPPLAGHSLSVLHFSRWNIGVYSTYLNIPSGPFGHAMHMTTSPPRENGVIDPEYTADMYGAGGGTDSIALDQLAEYLLQTNNLLAFGLCRKIYPLLPDAEKANFLERQYMFHPNVNSLFAERMGIPPLHPTAPHDPNKPFLFGVRRPKDLDSIFPLPKKS